LKCGACGSLEIQEAKIMQKFVICAAVFKSTAVKNLGVLIDSQLTMADHIAAVCQSGFFQLRQLWLIRQSLMPVAV